MIWMNSAMNQQSKQSLAVDPSVKVKDIKAKTRVSLRLYALGILDCRVSSVFIESTHHFIFPQELFGACNPIVTKPKPKVELPKEETPAEQNGPVDGQEKPQEAAADKGTTEAAGNPASETTESKPDMDLD